MTDNNVIISPTVSKVKRLAHLIKAILVVYLSWSLWRMVSYWSNHEYVAQTMGNYLHLDLSSMMSWQPWIAFGIGMISWGLLVFAVVLGWKFLTRISHQSQMTSDTLKLLVQCAWLVIFCQISAMLFRPLQTYALTVHLASAEHMFKWGVYPIDFLGGIIGLILLMMAYLFSWVLEVVEENRSFI